MSRRLSRKEIKRDEFMESVGGALEWVQGHLRTLMGLALAVIVALVIVGLYFSYSSRRQERAGEALAQALVTLEAEIDPVAAAPEDPDNPTFASAEARRARAREQLQKVHESFSGTDAGAIATAYLGQIAAAEGDLEAARGYWEEFQGHSGDSALAAEVEINLMALDRAQGRGDALVTRLRAMLSGSGEDLPPDLLWYQLGLTLEHLGRDVEAGEAFQRLIDDFPQSAYAAEARQRSEGRPVPMLGS